MMDRYLENNPVVGQLQAYRETVLIALDENSERDMLIGCESAQENSVEK